ncbi:hypothetical protein BRADI_1g61390v3 [Brachypodium distachyon]|nr:hypothetical protein BRADI_1g61390v3 [Brachypodium distachyon]
MSTVAKLPGIKSMAVDGDKGTLTVVGDVDVVCLASALRKAKFAVVVVSVGPEEVKKPEPPKPAPVEKKKADDPPKPPCCCNSNFGPGACNCCPRPGPMPPYGMVCYDEQPDGYGCIIM